MLLGRGGGHMVTLYWGPVPVMGKASKRPLDPESLKEQVAHRETSNFVCTGTTSRNKEIQGQGCPKRVVGPRITKRASCTQRNTKFLI